MPEAASIEHVILSSPSLLPKVLLTSRPSRSWVQLAKTGSFVSNRYGKFEISKNDLSQMLFNFTNITPKSPTELPIDWDHLSMDPKHPGDGAAAGWMKRLELREDGDELWAEVEWTRKGAEAIANQEYKFVSPSFVKDHVHKNGKKIGTTLLAAAITNHPFLEQMRALTLYSFNVHGDLALRDSGSGVAFNLAKIDDVVSFLPDRIKVPELTPMERSAKYKVESVEESVEGGQFVRVVTLDGGEPVGWFKVDQLAPAPAPKIKNKPVAPAPMLPQIPQNPQEALKAMQQTLHAAETAADVLLLASMDRAATHLNALAQTRSKEKRIDLGTAAKEIAKEQPDLVWRRDGQMPPAPVTTTVPTPILLSASAKAATTYQQLVATLKVEEKLNDLDAFTRASRLRPDLADAYSQGVF